MKKVKSITMNKLHKSKKVKSWYELEEYETLIEKPFIFDAIGPLKLVRKVGKKRVEFEIPMAKLLDYVWLIPTPELPPRIGK